MIQHNVDSLKKINLKIIISFLSPLITTIFTSMSISRCSKIVCCFGCFDCDREVVNDEVVARAVQNNNQT